MYITVYFLVLQRRQTPLQINQTVILLLNALEINRKHFWIVYPSTVCLLMVFAILKTCFKNHKSSTVIKFVGHGRHDIKFEERLCACISSR